MKSSKLNIGGIYLTEWDARPFRIIGLDDIEVFYDCLWQHSNSWTFSGNFKKKCFFYRTSTKLFEQKSNKIDFLSLTEEELNAFRPDLPLRFGRTKALNWNQFKFNDFESFHKFVKNELRQSFLDEKISCSSLVVLPYGDKGAIKKGVKLSADNGQHFKVSEIIWKAREVQESITDEVSKGIGLYRIGFEKGLPSYYIGEYLDKAGLIKE